MTIMEETERFILGRYRIVKELGRGGFGITYLAEDTWSSNLLCVIKKLDSQSADIETAKMLFQREAAILHTLQQGQQIPKYFNYFEQGTNYYIVEEYIKGKALDQLLGERWSQEEVIIFLKEILKILKYLHQEKIIHRDIKPSNLMRRDEDNKFVLIDFGAVKKLAVDHASNQQHSSYTVIGVPGYSPPEQMEGKPVFNSDIYALGITAIQLLTGIHPKLLKRDKEDNVICNTMNTIAPEDALAAILKKMVYSQPERRYQSVEDVLQDLNRIELETEISLPRNLTRPPKDLDRPTPTRPIKLRYIPVALLVVGAIAVCLEFINPFLRPLYYLDQGNRLLDRREPEAALEQFQKLMAIQPNSAAAWKGRGDALFSLGRHYGALESYNKAIAFQSNDVKALNNKGKVLYRLGRYKEALATHRLVLQIDSNNAEALSGEGLAYIGLRQYQKASESFDRAQKLKPDEPTVWLEEGLAIEPLDPKAARESYQEALRCYDDIVKDNQNNAIAWTDRGSVLLKLNRPQEALDSYQKALDIGKNFYEALLGKGNTLSILRKPYEALVAFNQASEIRPNDYQVWYNRGKILLENLKNYEEALNAFEKAIDLRESFHPAWLYKGLALSELKRQNEALTAFDKAKDLEPKDPFIWANRGAVLEQLGRNEEAGSSYKKAIELGFPPEQLKNVKKSD